MESGMDSPAHHGVTPIQSGPDRITHWAEDTDQGDAIKPGSEQKPEGRGDAKINKKYLIIAIMIGNK